MSMPTKASQGGQSGDGSVIDSWLSITEPSPDWPPCPTLTHRSRILSLSGSASKESMQISAMTAP